MATVGVKGLTYSELKTSIKLVKQFYALSATEAACKSTRQPSCKHSGESFLWSVANDSVGGVEQGGRTDVHGQWWQTGRQGGCNDW